MAHAGFPNGLNTTTVKIISELWTDSDETYRRLIMEVEDIPIGEISFRNKGGGTAEIGIKICEIEKQDRVWVPSF